MCAGCAVEMPADNGIALERRRRDVRDVPSSWPASAVTSRAVSEERGTNSGCRWGAATSEEDAAKDDDVARDNSMPSQRAEASPSVSLSATDDGADGQVHNLPAQNCLCQRTTVTLDKINLYIFMNSLCDTASRNVLREGVCALHRR